MLRIESGALRATLRRMTFKEAANGAAFILCIVALLVLLGIAS